MIELYNRSLKREALKYLKDNLGHATPIELSLLRIASSAPILLSSFEIENAADIEHGRGKSRIVQDLYEVFSDVRLDQQVVYALDPWMSSEDVLREDIVPQFVPSVVYEVGRRNELEVGRIDRAFTSCSSFVTLWFAADRSSEPHNVAISAFDQEGCLAWCSD